MKAAALAAISSIEVGTSPELEDTCIVEQDDLAILGGAVGTAGSQWSIVPVKCMLKTSGTPPDLPKRR
jgi:hypothetical protein